jgi:hypothetical protein
MRRCHDRGGKASLAPLGSLATDARRALFRGCASRFPPIKKTLRGLFGGAPMSDAAAILAAGVVLGLAFLILS